MLDFCKIREWVRKGFTPITIMLIPHNHRDAFNIRIPLFAILATLILSFIGVVSVFSMAVKTAEYYRLQDQVSYYTRQFHDVQSSITSLKRDELTFQRLFALGSRRAVLENLDAPDSGSIDLETLKLEIKKTIDTVGEIKDYLHEQRDIHLSTPQGRPAAGHVSSFFGLRQKPGGCYREFHSGMDWAASPGTPVTATADGIVSFSGRSGANGNLVVLEHGRGYSTFFAHNRANLVKVGQKVKRGDTIGYVGSTGNSTGPHVHYEIWQNGHPINPSTYIKDED